MQISVSNSVCVAYELTTASRNLLLEALTVTGSKPDFRTGERPVTAHYAIDQAGRLVFGSGLLPYVDQVLRQNGLAVSYQDCRTLPSFTDQYPSAALQFTPFLDQFEVAMTMQRQCRGVLNLATNYGKTFLIAYSYFKLGKPYGLVVVPTQALLHQTSADLARLLGLHEDDVGKVGDSQCDWRPLTVAVINSVDDWLSKHGALPYPFEMLVVDEGHKGVSTMYRRLAMCCDAFYRFWMSGTAYKKDDTDHEFTITGLAGPLIAQITNKQLVDWKRSCYPHIFWVDNKLEKADEPQGYHEQYADLKDDEYRNQLIAWIVRTAVLKYGLTTMVFVEHKDHAHKILQYLSDVDTWLVTGAAAANNLRIKAGMESGEIKSVIATSAWREGVSIPNLDVLVQATGRLAEHARDQEFGRVLRRSKLGHGWYFDFVDKGRKYPAKHSRARRKHMESHGFPVHTVAPQDLESAFNVVPLQPAC